jgi:hypothetical protein
VQINAKQVVLIIMAVLGFTAGATTQLNDLLGPQVAKVVVSVATFVNGLMAAALAPFLSNTQTVRDAADLEGVQVRVGREATPQLAALAVDPANESISPARGQEAEVAQKAEAVA